MATILVVDDEDFFRVLISEILSDEGYTVETANSADEARERFLANRFDMVITENFFAWGRFHGCH